MVNVCADEKMVTELFHNLQKLPKMYDGRHLQETISRFKKQWSPTFLGKEKNAPASAP